MVKEILPNLYKMEVPIPNNPLKALNSYVIKSRERNFIIDTGMNREECKTVINAGLRELNINLKDTDFFLTHCHSDHSGLISYLPTDSSVVYCRQPDADLINSGVVSNDYWEEMRSFASLTGLPELERKIAIEQHPGFKYKPDGHVSFTIVKDGDTISIGEYTFNCIETPGHTDGHTCLYEPDKKILISGDHVLDEITPNISLWSDDLNPLNDFLNSLDKIYALDVELVLPAHRNLIKNCKERIQELILHHEIRTNEILSILKKGSQNAYQIASQMKWDMTYKSWDLFPVPQKWFATGETLAHLKYLEEKQMILRKLREYKYVFSLI